MKTRQPICLLLWIWICLPVTQLHAQVAQWGYVTPMIQKLDAQLENFASIKYQTPVKVLIARSSIRSRVLARDLLASGVSDPSDVGMTMVFFGTMLYEHVDDLDQLFNQLPDIAAMERDMVAPTQQQRKKYLLLKPAMERFSQNPIGKLRLNVLYPGQVHFNLSKAFAPLADALDAANLPLIRNVWEPPVFSILQDNQFQLLLDRFDALKIDKKHLAVREILLQIQPALQIQEYRPRVHSTFHVLSDIVKVLEILQRQPTAFIDARPLIIEQFETGLSNFRKPQSRNIGQGQLELVLAFTDVMMRMDQLQLQLQDTLVYEKLIAKIITEADRGRIEPMHRWLYTILDNWYHIQRINRPTDSAYVPSHDVLNGRWNNLRIELAKLTQIMVDKLPMTLTAQHQQWLDECRNTRVMFDELTQIPLLATHRSFGLLAPLKSILANTLTFSEARAGSAVMQSHVNLMALSHQWSQADSLMNFKPSGVLNTHLPQIQARLDRDLKKWIAAWQQEQVNPANAAEILQPALALMQITKLFNHVVNASQDHLFDRMGLVDLDKHTTDVLLTQIPNHTDELARLFADAGNPQDMQLNLQRTHEDLSHLIALGRLIERYRDNTPADLNAPQTHLLSRLVWQPVSGECDSVLFQTSIQFCITAREWAFQKQQDDPKHRRELLKQMRELGNKINARLDELK